jgi:hypothetical protein
MNTIITVGIVALVTGEILRNKQEKIFSIAAGSIDLVVVAGLLVTYSYY